MLTAATVEIARAAKAPVVNETMLTSDIEPNSDHAQRPIAEGHHLLERHDQLFNHQLTLT